MDGRAGSGHGWRLAALFSASAGLGSTANNRTLRRLDIASHERSAAARVWWRLHRACGCASQCGFAHMRFTNSFALLARGCCALLRALTLYMYATMAPSLCLLARRTHARALRRTTYHHCSHRASRSAVISIPLPAYRTDTAARQYQRMDSNRVTFSINKYWRRAAWPEPSHLE